MNNYQDINYKPDSKKSLFIQDKNAQNKLNSTKDYFAEIWDNEEDEIWNNV